ncbi:MAG: hypothetical protein M3426_13970, partial [Actinomycetota bacterium]|nr:hypothetical protein [Actinomycetota bacterium]
MSGPPKNEHPPIEVSAGRRESQARSGRESPCGRPTTIPGDSLREQCAGEQEDYFATDDLTSRATTRRRRRLRETVSLGGRVSFLAVVAISLLASAACGGAGQARGDAPVADPEGAQETDVQERTPDAEGTVEGDGKDRAVARAGDAEARADSGAARAGNARAGTGDAQARTGGAVITGNSKGGGAGNVEGKDGPQEVTLRVTGEPGTAFSGACSVGGK